MNPRLEKLRQEREKLAEKLTSLTARLKALDEQILMEMLEKRPTAALPDEYRKTEEFVDEE